MPNQGFIKDKKEVLHSAAVLTAAGTVQNARGFAMACVQIEGISGDTVTFQCTIDGSTWYGVLAENKTTGIWRKVANSDGIYHVPVNGMESFRAYLTRVGGTVTVTSIMVTAVYSLPKVVLEEASPSASMSASESASASSSDSASESVSASASESVSNSASESASASASPSASESASAST